MLIIKIPQKQVICVQRSTLSCLFQARTRSCIAQIFKYLHSYLLFIHSQYEYIIKILIFFMSWLGRNQEGRGLRTSEGVKDGAGLQTINPDIRSHLNHLLSFIFLRHLSWLQANSMAMTFSPISFSC